MDWMRLSLLFGIGLCLYMLLLQWDKKQTEAAAIAVQEIPQTQSLTEPALPPQQQPAITASAPTTGSNTGLLNAPAQATGAAMSGEQVVIRSDSLVLYINLNGGDIERLDLRKYDMQQGRPEQPVRLMERTGPAQYFARQGLQYANGETVPIIFNSEQKEYESQGPMEVSLNGKDGQGLKVQRTYSLTPGSHLVAIRETLRNEGNETLTLSPYAAFYHNDLAESAAFFGLASYTGAAWGNSDDIYNKVSFGDMLDEQGVRSESTQGWIAMVQHYFVAAWVPEQDRKHLYQMVPLPNSKLFLAGLTSQAVQLVPGAETSYEMQLYAGPKHQTTLRKIAPGLDLTVDYGWLWWLGQPLFIILQWMHTLTGNWGWAIVLLTLLIKLTIYPLSAIGFRSMGRMRQLQPELERLRQRYGSDYQKMGEKTMELYRNKGVNPLGGCLPMLLPMPVFLALYWVLLESVELRHAPWMLWLQDLSARDPYFVLPLLMGLSMFATQMMSPPPATMNPMQRRMLQFMPLMFTIFFLWFPSGLVLYWLSNNLLSILQQWWINRNLT